MSGSIVAGNFSLEPTLGHTWRCRDVCLPTLVGLRLSGWKMLNWAVRARGVIKQIWEWGGSLGGGTGCR